jgi:hypothetical protein
MSFTSALPANLPKLQIITPFRRSLDVASGYEYVTSLIRMSADSAVAYDVYTPIRRYVDYGVGYDTYVHVESLILLKELDVAEGLEYLTRTVRVSDSPVALLEVARRVDRQLPTEVAKAIELLARTATVSDVGIGSYAVPKRQFSYRERVVGDERYVLARRYDAVLHGLEQFTVGYPVSVSVVQDAENAYQRAFQQLSTLQQGRYAYAHDWNVLADYAKSVLNILVDTLRRLYEKGYKYYIDPYNKALECQRILSTYRYLKTGDVIMPENTNTLIDVVRCLDETVRQLTLTKEIVMVDTDDWDTAKRYVSDGTIIFVNYGTQAMTPEEVRKIVDTIKAVFVVLINTQPYYGKDVGAFYDVFYTSRNPRRCDVALGCFDIIDIQFMYHSGFYSCYYPFCNRIGQGWGVWDYMVHATYKIGYAKTWAVGPCGFSYAKYNAGSIVEMPYDGVWPYVETLDMYIGIISRVLLGEENFCFIASRGRKVRRIVWMADYSSDMPQLHGCFPVDQCLAELAVKTGWRLVDLRRK